LIGSIRRECLDHVIVLNETGLRRILKSYFDYYGGLHHRYERIAAAVSCIGGCPETTLFFGRQDS
jgi:hypothetical protein